MYIFVFVVLWICAVFGYIIVNRDKVINSGKNLAIKYYIRRKLDTDEDYKQFNDFFETIRRDLTDLGSERLKSVVQRIDETVVYTVPDGKKFRGLFAVKVFKHFTSKEEMTREKLDACHAVGWFVEVIQAGYLIYDDIMDGSFTRRGKTCWYKHKDNAILAINDGSLLRMVSPALLKKYCRKFKHYTQILDTWFSLSQATMYGQILDCFTTPDGQKPDFTLFTDSRYETIVKYKTSLYTFVLPIRMAMYLANISDAEVHLKTEEILVRIGFLFQVQDDFLDAFGDPKITGKIGTDIEDGKCSWIALNAYKRMNEQQKHWFERCYGRKDEISVRVVRKLFDELAMKKVFVEFEEKEFVEISEMITDFERNCKIDFKILSKTLKLIYKRQK